MLDQILIHQNIIARSKIFLKSLGINDAIIKLEDDFDLSAEIKKLETFFFILPLDGLPLDYILNESMFHGI